MSDEFQMEQERRFNNLVIEVATMRETVRSSREQFDGVKHDLHGIQSSVTQVSNSLDRMSVTLKYIIDEQIKAALVEVNEQLTLRKEEAIVRKTQIAMLSLISGGIGSVIAIIAGFVFKLWGLH